MFAQERHNAIRKFVREQRRLSFAQLQELVDVSPATLRRDLTDLEKSGAILRVHGGVLDPGYLRSEISFDERLLRNSAAKKAIASKAASLIPPGSVVFVDAGSTCLEAGRILLGRSDLTIVTHSVALIGMSLHGQAKMICPGGELRRISGALVGGSALGGLGRIRTGFALIGASGMTKGDCSTTEFSEAEMKRAILQGAERKILLADSSKWDQTSTVLFCDWSVIDDWVTDKVPASARVLSRLGVTIHASFGK
jgi:DeoR/GlpR family transcriptional regulator of sugar metabolism